MNPPPLFILNLSLQKLQLLLSRYIITDLIFFHCSFDLSNLLDASSFGEFSSLFFITKSFFDLCFFLVLNHVPQSFCGIFD